MRLKSWLIAMAGTVSTAAFSLAVAVTGNSKADVGPTFEAVPAELKAELKQALKQAAKSAEARVKAGQTADARTTLAGDIEKAAAKLDPQGDAATVLSRALADAKLAKDDTDAIDRLQGGISEANIALDFKPILEAPFPEGFPGPGPVAKVIVKEYPAYRQARTTMPNGKDDSTPFWTLFQHIQTNKIEMTAPVEMAYKQADQKVAATSMAFLYQSQKLGKAGLDGKVEVIDLPAVTVVSIGLRGQYNDAKIAESAAKLEAWLAAHKEFEKAGEPRLMGYNSPMILPWMRYAEVQIPVRKTTAEKKPAH